jgi:hypothetical protein
MTTGEIGARRYFKAPTLGRALSTADSQQITLAAVGKKPFSPVGLRAQRTSGDANYASTTLTLLAEGTNGSTTFTDSSFAANTITSFGSAQISTAQFKYGGSSALFNGTSSYLTAPTGASAQFPGDFTIETWIYVTPASLTAGAGKMIFDTRATGLSSTSITLYQFNTGINFFASGTSQIISGAFLTASTWIHVALTRSGSSIRLFIDGVQRGGTYSSAANYSDGLCFVGRDSTAASQYFDGYMDDFRITKGVARYTSGFGQPPAVQTGVAGDITLSWDRRTRLAKNFTNGFVPLGETSESYSIDVFTSNVYTTIARTISSPNQSASYTNAQQVADFGSAQATIYVDVYQISAATGRGTKLRGAV